MRPVGYLIRPAASRRIQAMNDRLRTVMVQRGVGVQEVAEACEVDPKTVERWVTVGRIPHRRHRWTAAKFLNADEVYLWPELLDREATRRQGMAEAELIHMYPNRATVPRELWARLIGGAQRHIDVLVFSGTFFSQMPRVASLLEGRAQAGAKVRLCFGEPSCDAVKIRDREEGLRGTLASKIHAALTYFDGLRDVSGCDIRLHATTLYTSIFRFDDEVMVNPHAWGQPASTNPLFHFQRIDGASMGVFDHYVASFDAVWTSAAPCSAEIGR